jgi:hypothetical protein
MEEKTMYEIRTMATTGYVHPREKLNTYANDPCEAACDLDTMDRERIRFKRKEIWFERNKIKLLPPF